MLYMFNMASLQNIVFGISLILVAVFVQQSYSISCFVCNSEPKYYDGKACDDPFDVNSNLAQNFLTNCSEEYSKCRKIIQTVDEDVRVIRQCGKDKDSLEYERAGTHKIKMLYYHCLDDKCNTATNSKPVMIVIAFSSVLAMLVSKLYL